jgi:hypothetical protein
VPFRFDVTGKVGIFQKSGHIMRRTPGEKSGHCSRLFSRAQLEKSGHFHYIPVMRRFGITYFAVGVCQEV